MVSGGRNATMAVYRGVVKGNTVVLEGPADLADGTVVEVRPVGDSIHADDMAVREEAFKQHLHDIGLLRVIRRPQPDAPDIDRTPVPILSGPPVSETIIEERL
jgi:hypothetical protein